LEAICSAGCAASQLPEDLDLPFPQLVERRSRAGTGFPSPDVRDVVAHRMFAARHGADRLDERGRLAALGDIAARPGAEGGLHQRGLAVHAEHQDA
jgi:hypothetical protein